MPIWRLVLRGVATKEALDTKWSIDEFLRATAILQMRDDIEAMMMPKEAKE